MQITTSAKSNRVSLASLGACLVALVALGIVFSIVIRPGMPQAQPVLWATLNFAQQREVMETAVMQTELALIETITPEAPPTGRPPTLTPAPFVPGIFEISTYLDCPENDQAGW